MNAPAFLTGWVTMGATSLVGGAVYRHAPFGFIIGTIILSLIVGTALGSVIFRDS